MVSAFSLWYNPVMNTENAKLVTAGTLPRGSRTFVLYSIYYHEKEKSYTVEYLTVQNNIIGYTKYRAGLKSVSEARSFLTQIE